MLLRYFTTLMIFFSMNGVVKAEESKTLSIGEFANELLTPVSILGSLITKGSLILGVICFFAGFIRFMEYRKNSYAAPLSSVLALVLPGLVFVSLPFLSFIVGAEINPLQK